MANTYGFDPVAWAIDGGRHRAELLRVLAYAATSGNEGIITVGDCRVHALSTAGGQVQIDPGGLLIRNRSTGVKNQTYVANGRTVTTLDVTGGGGSGRSDLVVVRIEDPQYAPWPPAPAGQAPDYQYVKPFIIQNVPSSTIKASQLNLGYSAVALARIDIPAGVSTITNTMIKDLRKVAQPREERTLRIYQVPTGRYDGTLGSTDRSWFPRVNESIYCPEWATSLRLKIDLVGIRLWGDRSWGRIRGEYGWNSDDTLLVTQETGYDHEGSFFERQTIACGDTLYVPPSFRDKDHYVRTGQRSDSRRSNNAQIYVDEWSTCFVDCQFEEVPD